MTRRRRNRQPPPMTAPPPGPPGPPGRTDPYQRLEVKRPSGEIVYLTRAGTR